MHNRFSIFYFTMLFICLPALTQAGCNSSCGPEDFPITVGSWGGKVRSGPGLEFDQVGSTIKGEHVQLLQESGPLLDNGYPWYKIQFQDGKSGYQWGGLLCGADWQKLYLHDKCDWLLPGEIEGDTRPGRGEICNDLPCSETNWPVLVGSWGGKIRSGPGMDFDQVGSTHQGDTLFLVRKTDQQMNGYPWYEIETAQGDKGYQWGGLLCGPGWKYLNIYGQCRWRIDETDLETLEGVVDSLG